MKPTLALRTFLLGSTLLAAATSLDAATLYWDGTDTTANADGGVGNWNTATNWDNAPTGGANTAWNNTSPDTAVFGGVGGTVTLGAVRTAAGITFTTGGYDLINTAARILTIGSGGITVTSGAGALNRIGNGSANTGHVTLSANQVWLNQSNQTLQQRDGTLVLGSNTLTLNSTGGGTILASGTTTGSGTGNIIVSANTSVTMSSNNSYSGTTTINSGGILTVNSLSDFNAAGGLGQKTSNLASNLLIDGGTLRVQVASNTSDRLFTVGAGGATFEAMNTGANSGQIQFTGATPVSYSGTGNRTITIGGISDDVGGSSIARAIDDVGGGNGTVALAKTGSHNWTVSGTNTFTGGTSVSAGTLTMGSASALGSTSGQLTVDAGTLNMDGNNLTVGNLTGTGGTISGTSGTRLLTIGQGDGGGGNFQGAITGGTGGNSALTKTGTGTITLSGTNTYTGATNVTGGVLAVNGSLANTSTTIATGGTLQGSGTIGGSVTIQGGGTLASGNSIESLATGALSLQAFSTLSYEINNDVAPGVAADLTAVTGTLTIDLGNAAILTLTELGGGSWTNGEKLTLISYTGAWNGGLFNFGGTALADDSTFTFDTQRWLFNYNDTVAGSNYTGDLTTPSYVTMTAIPEPRAALLGAIGLLALLRRRR